MKTKPKPPPEVGRDPHMLDMIESIGNDRRWVCSCGLVGIPVGNIVADGKAFVTGDERAREAFVFHTQLAKAKADRRDA